MPRRARKIAKRESPPDAKYGSTTVAKFIVKIMLRGQKSTAEHVAYDAMEIASQRLNISPAELLEQAIENATPLIRVKPRRVGGATYQVPIEVAKHVGRSLAMRWLVASARARSGKSMAEKLAGELIDAAQGQGPTIKKRDDIHRMAEANKAFVHYRW